MNCHDTIVAIATPVGIGGIGIIRISGSRSSEIVEKIFRKRKNRSIPALQPYRFYLGEIFDPLTEEVIDEVLLVSMPGPRSYTCEDVIEIQCHSGYLVLQRILDLVLGQEGVRLAEPGEFTRRAFVNGRIDLTQVEAVIDLIRARTDSALRQATGQLGGMLSRRMAGFKERLITLLANIDSSIDFPEEDLDTLPPEEILGRLRELEQELVLLVSTYREGKIFREGLNAAIIGRPNVGKSSLLNALLEEERAIVCHLPGTTRDTIEETVNILGIAVTLIDTAGLPLSSIANPAERKGVDLTRAKALEADIVLFVLDGSSPFTSNDMAIFEEIQDKKMVVILNKADLPPQLTIGSLPEQLQRKVAYSVSARYCLGIDALKRGIRDVIMHNQELSYSPVFINRVRHKVSLDKAVEAIGTGIRNLESNVPAECLAMDLTLALKYLGEIAGETSTEDVLEHIFSEFCIGK